MLTDLLTQGWTTLNAARLSARHVPQVTLRSGPQEVPHGEGGAACAERDGHGGKPRQDGEVIRTVPVIAASTMAVPTQAT